MFTTDENKNTVPLFFIAIGAWLAVFWFTIVLLYFTGSVWIVVGSFVTWLATGFVVYMVQENQEEVSRYITAYVKERSSGPNSPNKGV